MSILVLEDETLQIGRRSIMPRPTWQTLTVARPLAETAPSAGRQSRLPQHHPSGAISMARPRKDEARALDTDERELVEKSHHPAVQTLDDAALLELLKLVRERRDRAQRLARTQRRERRGKTSPRGAAPATDDAGSQRKAEILATAVRRLNAEHERRRRKS
jgi:hypothetical protein